MTEQKRPISTPTLTKIAEVAARLASVGDIDGRERAAVTAEVDRETERRRGDRQYERFSVADIRSGVVSDLTRAGRDVSTRIRTTARALNKELRGHMDELRVEMAQTRAERRQIRAELPLPLKASLETTGVYGGDSIQLALLRELRLMNARAVRDDVRLEFDGRPVAEQLTALEAALGAARGLESQLRDGRRYAAMREGERLLSKEPTPNFAAYDAAAIAHHEYLTRAQVLEQLVSAALPQRLLPPEEREALADFTTRRAIDRLHAVQESLVDDETREAEAAEQQAFDAMDAQAMIQFATLRVLGDMNGGKAA